VAPNPAEGAYSVPPELLADGERAASPPKLPLKALISPFDLKCLRSALQDKFLHKLNVHYL